LRVEDTKPRGTPLLGFFYLQVKGNPMKEKIYITSSIPYVNAKPHIGHALELVQADASARFHRLEGRETVFQTGTDENAFKNVLAAREQGLSTQELVDRNSRIFQDLKEALDISAGTFLRTTESRHREGAAQLWKKLRPEDIYSKPYRGLYCTGCEDFILERDLVDGMCPEHQRAPVQVEEENYFFRLSYFEKLLARLIREDTIRVVPEKRKNEVMSFVKGGLKDISVSRDAGRAGGWGIPVPGDQSQVIYVWVDALINYITGQGFGSAESWNEVWNQDVHKIHVIGKDIWKFHAVYWPALLLSAELPLPDEIMVHGFLTVEGQKMSKSLGNAADPFECIERTGSDALRYHLLRAVSPFEDGDFSQTHQKRLYNSDLANGLGNLASRIAVLWEKAGGTAISLPDHSRPPAGLAEAMRSYGFDRAIQLLWKEIGRINRDIDAKRPWEKLKQENTEDLDEDLNRWIGGLYRIGRWLEPFLPKTAGKIVTGIRDRRRSSLRNLFPRIE
jgi:methionyl-tRNA synthetase